MRGAVDVLVDMPVGLSDAVVTGTCDDVGREFAQHLEFFRPDALGRPRRGLSGQHTENGEAVQDVAGTDADHRHATARGDLDQAFEGQLEQRLAHRGWLSRR